MTELGDIPSTDDLATTAHIFPVATIMPWGSSSIPSGWLSCDGRTLDGTNALYINLYNNIGVMYGGTGQNAFKIPALNASAANGSASRIPVGKHPGGPTEVDTNGKTGGSIDHTHGVGSYSVPAHAHGVGSLIAPDHGHGHNLSNPDHYHKIRADLQSFYGGSDFQVSAGDGGQLDCSGFGFCGFYTGWSNGGTSGGISNSGNFSLGGTSANSSALGFSGTSGTSNPPYVSFNYIIKL